MVQPPEPPFQLGPYRVLGELGRGSFATVYRAVVPGMHGFEVVVALKVLHPHHLDPPTVRLFASEARSLALLRHGNIVRVHRFVEVPHPTMGAVPVLEMELVSGTSLKDVLTRSRFEDAPPPLAAVLEVARGIARALAYAHRPEEGRPGLVHRDLKPSNVMIAGDGTPRLLDFGIARIARAGPGRPAPAGTPEGTLGYMAPEQLLDPARVDGRADLFACGAILFEMLTLRRPVEAGHPAAAAFLLERFDPDACLATLPAPAMPLAPIVRELLASDPARRTASAADLVEALERLAPSLGGRGRDELSSLATAVDEGGHRVRGCGPAGDQAASASGPHVSLDAPDGGRGKVLYDLLVEAFRRPSDMVAFVASLPGVGPSSQEGAAAPSNSSHAAQWAVDLLEGGSLVGPRLFERLATLRPDLREAIGAAGRRWGVEALGDGEIVGQAMALGPPPGTPYDPGYYVARPVQERLALDCLRRPGKPVVIWGPPRSGKTWFASHILRTASEEDPAARSAFVDLDDTTRRERGSLDAFLRWLGFEMLRQLGPTGTDPAGAWPQRGPANVRFTRFLHEQILRDGSSPTILAIDRADRIRMCAFNDDFFGLLRARAQAAGGPPWNALRLLLVLSAGPAELTDDPNRSPVFGLSDPIGMAAFGRAEVAGLAAQYGRQLGPDRLDALLGESGGNPWQIRRRLYEATLDRSC